MRETTMTTEIATPRVPLDWSRLLGFDQATVGSEPATAPGLNDPRLAKLGAKFGGKKGEKRP
jgi:hypothetical protein